MNDKQQLAAMGEHMAEQEGQPMCMAKRVEELEALLRKLREDAEIYLNNCKVCKYEDGISSWANKLERIDAVLAGKTAQHVPEDWRLVPAIPTPEMLDMADQAAAETGGFSEVWEGMLEAAPKPEAKP